MTCREKLKKEHPNYVKNDCWAGCTGCPHSYGYMPIPDYCPYTGNNTSLDLNERLTLCIRCWNRDIPEQESGTKSEPTEPKPTEQKSAIPSMSDLHWLLRKALGYPGITVSITFMEDVVTFNAYPYPIHDGSEGEDK